MEGSEGKMSIKACLIIVLGSLWTLFGKERISFGWLIRLDLFLICHLGINSFLSISRAISLLQGQVHLPGLPQGSQKEVAAQPI